MGKYLAWRLNHKHGATIKKGAYRGLDPDGPLFLTEDGSPMPSPEERCHQAF